MYAFVLHSIVTNGIQFESNSRIFFNFWHNLIKESVGCHYTINKDSERRKKSHMFPYVCGFKCSLLYTFHTDPIFIVLGFTIWFLTLISFLNVINTFKLFLLSSQNLIVYVIYFDKTNKGMENAHNVYIFWYN